MVLAGSRLSATVKKPPDDPNPQSFKPCPAVWVSPTEISDTMEQRQTIFVHDSQIPEDFLGGTSGKEPACQCKNHKRRWFDPWVGKISWRRWWQPTPVFLPGKSHGQRNMVGYSPWGHKESDTTEATGPAQIPWAQKNYSYVTKFLGWLHSNR